jgi:hypothetical protein
MHSKKFFGKKGRCVKRKQKNFKAEGSFTYRFDSIGEGTLSCNQQTQR